MDMMSKDTTCELYISRLKAKNEVPFFDGSIAAAFCPVTHHVNQYVEPVSQMAATVSLMVSET